MVYVISDLHGYPFERFLSLLESAGFCDEDHLYVIGDVIDRGKEGIQYLLWLKEQHNAELILGNHEVMMTACTYLFEEDALGRMQSLDNNERVSLGIWMSNGAEPTVRGLFGIDYEQRASIFSYLKTCPLYRRINVGGKDYLLVHSGLRDFDKNKALEDYSERDLIWNRPQSGERYFDDCTTVFGHTPTFFFGDEHKGKPIYTDTWINIDAGAGYGLEPVLLRLDDLKEFSLKE